jgi:hypothetical protein
MEKAIANFRNEVKVLRDKIENYLISLLETHDTNSVDCYVCEGCPVIIDGVTFDDDYSTYTLDRINLYLGNDGKYIEFDCSNACTNDSVSLNDMDIERLIEVYEWVSGNEVELFENAE